MMIKTDNLAEAPYGYQNNFWVGFDDESSLRTKVNKLIKGRNLMGAMFWALDLDDFTGQYCNKGKYPLINAVKDELKSGAPETTSSVVQLFSCC